MNATVSSYQTGDLIASIEGAPMVLRLTLGALAEMSEVTGAHSPFALAAVIKAGQPENITAIVKACLRPLNGAVDINNAQAREIFSRLSPVFEQAFNLEPRP